MRILLDTHAFLWWLADSKRLSGAAHASIVDESNDIAVSAASAWEIAIKFNLGELPDGASVAMDIADHIVSQGFVEMAVSVTDAERAGRLPGLHRDPFDRMLIAQSIARDMTIVSIDNVFDRYGVHRLW